MFCLWRVVLVVAETLCRLAQQALKIVASNSALFIHTQRLCSSLCLEPHMFYIFLSTFRPTLTLEKAIRGATSRVEVQTERSRT